MSPHINDYFIHGKGMGQLLSSSGGMTIPALLENPEYRKKLQKIEGRLDDVDAKIGKVSIQSPIAWQEQEARFQTGTDNSLGSRQLTHKVAFYGGFSFEKITAIDSQVVDIDAGESLISEVSKRSTSSTSLCKDKKDFAPFNALTGTLHQKSPSLSNQLFTQLLEQTYPKDNGIIQRPPANGKLTKNTIYEGSISDTDFQGRNRIAVEVGFSRVSVDYIHITGSRLNKDDIQKLVGKTAPVKIIEAKKGFYIGQIKAALDRLGE